MTLRLFLIRNIKETSCAEMIKTILKCKSRDQRKYFFLSFLIFHIEYRSIVCPEAYLKRRINIKRGGFNYITLTLTVMVLGTAQ